MEQQLASGGGAAGAEQPQQDASARAAARLHANSDLMCGMGKACPSYKPAAAKPRAARMRLSRIVGDVLFCSRCCHVLCASCKSAHTMRVCNKAATHPGRFRLRDLLDAVRHPGMGGERGCAAAVAVAAATCRAAGCVRPCRITAAMPHAACPFLPLLQLERQPGAAAAEDADEDADEEQPQEALPAQQQAGAAAKRPWQQEQRKHRKRRKLLEQPSQVWLHAWRLLGRSIWQLVPAYNVAAETATPLLLALAPSTTVRRLLPPSSCCHHSGQAWRRVSCTAPAASSAAWRSWTAAAAGPGGRPSPQC